MSASERGRGKAVLGFLIAGGIGIISSTQTWLTVTRADAGEPILIPGSDAVPLLAPLSLAVLALGAALAIVGTVLRHVLAALGLAAAVLLAWWSIDIALQAPLSAVAPIVIETTGLAGSGAVADVVAEITPSFWPVLAVVGWVLLAIAAAFALLTAAKWRSGGKRFRTDANQGGDGPVDAIDSWDDLSRGSDPTR